MNASAHLLWIIDLAEPTVDKKKTDQENFSIMLSLETQPTLPSLTAWMIAIKCV